VNSFVLSKLILKLSFFLNVEVVYINTESQIEKIDKRLRHISYYRAKADKPFNIADARCLQQKFFDNIYFDIVRHYVILRQFLD